MCWNQSRHPILAPEGRTVLRLSFCGIDAGAPQHHRQPTCPYFIGISLIPTASASDESYQHFMRVFPCSDTAAASHRKRAILADRFAPPLVTPAASLDCKALRLWLKNARPVPRPAAAATKVAALPVGEGNQYARLAVACPRQGALVRWGP